MNMVDIIRPQFEAGLSMLCGAIDAADEGQWQAPVGERAFWELAYHTVFYTHLYLSRSVDTFEGRPTFAGESSHGLGRTSEPPFEPCDPGPPVDRVQTLAYAKTAREKLLRVLGEETDETLAGPSGFFWLPFSRAELYLYNLRHVQHHTGQLHIALRRSGKQPGWKGSGW